MTVLAVDSSCAASPPKRSDSDFAGSYGRQVQRIDAGESSPIFRYILNSACDTHLPPRFQLRTLTEASDQPMDFAGKQSNVVDFGGEFDYGAHEWFQDGPERPPPPQAQPASTPYVPHPGVIEQNEAFEFALSAAPNVLYGRYKQYGQLGVLAWCSEFGELIDGLKDLGFHGNMFVSTRAQALRACEDILKLKLEVKMQIIVMYLSSQVARLRRFLDGENTWNDYPEPQFPLDPRAYGT